jgi:hypothetical protein
LFMAGVSDPLCLVSSILGRFITEMLVLLTVFSIHL